MQITDHHSTRHAAITAMFARSFTASDGPNEGVLIADLVARLLRETPASDLRVFTALKDGMVLGTILFTRLHYPDDPRRVFLLSPVAVAPDCQREGIGTALISFGLTTMRAEGIDFALTYGDPAFYTSLGFAPISTDDAPPPQPLNHPEGWLGQSLSDASFPLTGPSHCASALDDPAFW